MQAYIHVKKFLNEMVTGYPTIFFMNNGKVISKQIGGTGENVIIQQLNSLTSSNKPQFSKNNIKIALASKKNKNRN